MKLFLTTIPLYFLIVYTISAQGIKGTVKDGKGQPLPYTSIYVSNLKDGSSTNLQGDYEIKLPPGKYDLLVQFIGYETRQVQVEVNEDWVIRDFVLEEQILTLKEVEIRGSAEDPALTIMRKAIAKSKYHLLQYDSYDVKVYIKGTGQLEKAPFFLKNKLKKEGVVVNEAYTSESVSEINFSQPDKIEEKVISIRTSGENASASPSPYINQSFYNDKIAGAVSPLSRSAFVYYRFSYEGSFMEGDIEINKIRVKPRSKGEQVFDGYIYIIEDLWAIHSLDLQTSMLGFQAKVKQNYAEIAPKLWMPVTHQYLFSGKMLGFAGEFRYLVSFSDYEVELNQDLIAETNIIDEKIEEVSEDLTIEKASDKEEVAEVLATEDEMTRKQFRKMINQYEKEALKAQKNPEVVSERTYIVDSLAIKRDAAYWSKIRPVPLTDKENRGYERDDSLARIQTARITGKDSTGVITKRAFKITDIILGGNYNLSPRLSFNLNPTFTQVFFNTVEGWNINMGGRLTYQYDSLKRKINFLPKVRYGFSSEDFYAKGRLSHSYIHSGTSYLLFMEGGKFVEQFNDEEPIHPLVNTFSSLLFRRNFMKIYEKTFGMAGATFRPNAGFEITGSLEWMRRNELFNKTDYSFRDEEIRTYTFNQPANSELGSTGFPLHDALIFKTEMRYRPGITYRIYNGEKIPNYGRAPELLLMYRKGIANILGSDVNFDQIELGLNHSFAFGVSGELDFELRGGTFLNDRKMYFMDYQHFDGNRTILSSLKPAGAFRLLDYYNFSTNGSYFSGHSHYQFRKFLLTQLPKVRFSGLRENIFVNYLKTETSPNYYELGYSIDNILRLFRVEVAASFQDGDFQEVGLRIGIATIFEINVE